MKFLRKILAVILLIISVISSGGLLLASYVHYCSPELFTLPALLGLLFPVFALATAFVFIIQLIVYPRYALVPFISLLLAIPALQRYTPINNDKEGVETNRPSFTLLSYNVYHYIDTKKEPGYDDITQNRTIQYIIDCNADIVAMQESSSYWGVHKKNKITKEQIDIIEQRYPYRINKNRSYILSKYPVELISDTLYTKTANTSVYRLNIDGHSVTLFNNHLESIGLTSDDKQLYREIKSYPDSIGEKIDGIKIFTSKFLNAFKSRATQVQYIDSLAREIGGNIIMCGDINDTPNSYAYHILQHERNDAYLELGSGPGYTYQTDRMWVRIDYIFYQGEFTAKQLQKGDFLYSDHYPLLVTFEWND